MDPAFASATDLSLLSRLRRDPTDQVAWGSFVQRYGRRIYLWCRRWQLQEADAENVTQNVLLILSKQLREFQYDPTGRFRSWLKTVTHHAWSKYVTGEQKHGRGSGDSRTVGLLHSLEARDDLAAKLEEEFDREVLELAMLRVAQRVETHTWRAFQLLAMQGLPGAEVAAALEMPVGMVYVAKSRVQKMIQDEIRLLEGGE
jgi:RNA polymerase sigma factor (sigma-70 family)